MTISVAFSYQEQLSIFTKVINWIKSQENYIQLKFKVKFVGNELDKRGMQLLVSFLDENKVIELEMRG